MGSGASAEPEQPAYSPEGSDRDDDHEDRQCDGVYDTEDARQRRRGGEKKEPAKRFGRRMEVPSHAKGVRGVQAHVLLRNEMSPEELEEDDFDRNMLRTVAPILLQPDIADGFRVSVSIAGEPMLDKATAPGSGWRWADTLPGNGSASPARFAPGAPPHGDPDAFEVALRALRSGLDVCVKPVLPPPPPSPSSCVGTTPDGSTPSPPASPRPAEAGATTARPFPPQMPGATLGRPGRWRRSRWPTLRPEHTWAAKAAAAALNSSLPLTSSAAAALPPILRLVRRRFDEFDLLRRHSARGAEALAWHPELFFASDALEGFSIALDRILSPAAPSITPRPSFVERLWRSPRAPPSPPPPDPRDALPCECLQSSPRGADPEPCDDDDAVGGRAEVREDDEDVALLRHHGDPGHPDRDGDGDDAAAAADAPPPDGGNLDARTGDGVDGSPRSCRVTSFLLPSTGARCDDWERLLRARADLPRVPWSAPGGCVDCAVVRGESDDCFGSMFSRRGPLLALLLEERRHDTDLVDRALIEFLSLPSDQASPARMGTSLGGCSFRVDVIARVQADDQAETWTTHPLLCADLSTPCRADLRKRRRRKRKGKDKAARDRCGVARPPSRQPASAPSPPPATAVGGVPDASADSPRSRAADVRGQLERCTWTVSGELPHVVLESMMDPFDADILCPAGDDGAGGGGGDTPALYAPVGSRTCYAATVSAVARLLRLGWTVCLSRASADGTRSMQLSGISYQREPGPSLWWVKAVVRELSDVDHPASTAAALLADSGPAGRLALVRFLIHRSNLAWLRSNATATDADSNCMSWQSTAGILRGYRIAYERLCLALHHHHHRLHHGPYRWGTLCMCGVD